MSGRPSQRWNDQAFRRGLITALRAWNSSIGPESSAHRQHAAQVLLELCEGNAAGSTKASSSTAALETVDRLLDFPSHRLAVYGSLAPGKANHHMMAGMAGTWRSAVLRGSLRNEGWGAGQGFPGFLWDGADTPVAAQVFSSPDLPRHWRQLDEFEGPEYRRILVPVEIEGGEIQVCNVYELA
jgi:gamma-glutamylcyclotransferase (GGCT)/AIG2-like uncharacterized protein YtfP